MPARRTPLTSAALALLAVGALAGCGGHGDGTAADGKPPTAAANVSPDGGHAQAERLPQRLPGVGPRTTARIPADAQQVVLVTGHDEHSPHSTAVLYQRTADGWQAGASWPAHNALDGWTTDHYEGDLHSPEGVFTLTDAGGLLANPGTKLPYTHSYGFTATGAGFEGEPLAGAFNYVVAINYNHVPGTSPLSTERPMGASRGGGIWIHVDHGGPTHGCVSLTQDHMKELLRALDPARHPVIVMGDVSWLAQ
ncbi:L,D-transpeptidase family protein [Streptantibioticus parmotrematis]|uniref:L,D-transpeptidase family protein n=1 Tax=Streptantibioticus parmotrematis TaxID=2873249 RepID=UPI0033DA86AB